MSQESLEKPSKIRVLVSGCLPPPTGGMATFYRSLLSSSLGEQVDLFFVQTSSQKRALSKSGTATPSNLVSALRDCVRFTKAVLSNRPQVCHIGTAFGLSFIKHGICVGIARGLGSRVLLHPHCSMTILYAGRSRRWQWLFRQIIKLTDGVVALSHEWIQLRSIVPACRVYELPNAIDLTPYRPLARERTARANGSDLFRILYLGYLGKAKGSFDLIAAAKEALSQGVEISVDLVGDELTPGERWLLCDRVEKAELYGNVRVYPAASGSQKLAFFRRADAFVYPSYHEGMPMAVLEAMASGLPIVATRVGGLPDLVVDGVNGVLVEPGRPDQLAAALGRLALDSELCHSMQQKSYQFAIEQHDIEQCVMRLVDIYKTVLSDM